MFVMSKLTGVELLGIYTAYPSMQNYYTHKYFLYFYAFSINFILYVYFIVHIVTVFFCMYINK